MEGLTATTEHEGNRIVLRVEKWPEGFYIFFFRNNEQGAYRDELQPTLDIVMEIGREYFGLSKDDWREETWKESYR